MLERLTGGADPDSKQRELKIYHPMDAMLFLSQINIFHFMGTEVENELLPKSGSVLCTVQAQVFGN